MRLISLKNLIGMLCALSNVVMARLASLLLLTSFLAACGASQPATTLTTSLDAWPPLPFQHKGRHLETLVLMRESATPMGPETNVEEWTEDRLFLLRRAEQARNQLAYQSDTRQAVAAALYGELVEVTTHQARTVDSNELQTATEGWSRRAAQAYAACAELAEDAELSDWQNACSARRTRVSQLVLQ